MPEFLTSLGWAFYYFSRAELLVLAEADDKSGKAKKFSRPWELLDCLVLGQDALAAYTRRICDIEILQAMEDLRSLRAVARVAPGGITPERCRRAVKAARVVMDHLQKIEDETEDARARGDVVAFAAGLFGGTDEAWEWMNRPTPGFDNKRPIELMKDSEGRASVENYLLQVDSGA